MKRKLVIEPVTRVEGHGKITIHLDEKGDVADARFHVVEFRGFEKFCEGRLFFEMPSITARICGICPISHILASSKAGDAILGVEVPRPARMLRELMHMGQVIQSHALSFFHLSSPDLLLGFDADPAVRNIMGIIESQPDIARRGIRLRQFGQEVIALVAGRKIHPTFSIPGGVNKSLSQSERDQIASRIDEALDNVRFAIDLIKRYQRENTEMVNDFARFPSNYMGLVRSDGSHELYDGFLRLKGKSGEILEDMYPPEKYLDIISEATEKWSYLKFPFYSKQGYPDGAYRVGALGRLNVADRMGSPLADAELREFREISGDGGPVEGTFYYHYGRMIEVLHCIERVRELIEDGEICSSDIIAGSDVKNNVGVGVIEAPRGTLFHHYWVDDDGRLERVNLIVSTGQNNVAMNKSVLDIARKYVSGDRLTEGMLNRVEAAIRCYDPCLSCSTHAVGKMPLSVDLISSEGDVLSSISRG